MLFSVTMRFALLVAALVVTPTLVFAKPPPAPTAATVPAPRADPSVVAKAALTKDLPKLAPADKSALDGVVRDLKADRFEAAVSHYRAWTNAPKTPLTREEAEQTALWAFREGVLVRHDDLAASADKIRFLDERNAALDDSIALLRAAAVAKKPVLVARIVELTPYVRAQPGNTVRERQIGRDTYEAEIQKLTTPSDETRAERDRARAAFKADPRILQCLGEMTKSASYAKLVAKK
jgi:hypothetical protein